MRGEDAALQNHINSSFVNLGKEGIVHVTRNDGVPKELAYAGQLAWREKKVKISNN